MMQRIASLIFHGKSRNRYCWTLRVSSQSFSGSHGTFGVTWSQFARRWCQSTRDLGEWWGWPFWSRWVFKNVSWGSHRVPCIVRQPRIAANRSSGTRKSRVDWQRGTLQSCSLSQDHRILFLHFEEFTLSCSSWIWDKSWFTVEGFSFFCIESSSIPNCLTLSACLQQIVRNSSIYWQPLAWCS